MWQDILALFIVLTAALVALRIFLPVGLFRFGVGHHDAASPGGTVPSSGCGGCTAGSACFKMQVKAASVATPRRHG